MLVAVGCSTTKRLAEGELLYTGVRHIDIRSMTQEAPLHEVEAAVRAPLGVKPSGSFMGTNIRLPFGLWAYNAFYTERRTGLRARMFRTFATTPVTVSDVQPELRTKLVRDILDNHGFFASEANFKIDTARRGRKARISYEVRTAAPWYYSSVEFPPVADPVTRAIDSLRAGTLIRVGDRYNIDSLSDERVRITNALRNDSYYYFRPDYLHYLADTIRRRFDVDMRMTMVGGIPAAALRPYRIGNVNIQIYNLDDSGPMMMGTLPDSTLFWYQTPLRVRPKILQRAITISPGEAARVDDIDRTLDNLTRLGIFRYVNMTVTPLDLIREDAETLDMTLSMAMDLPMDAQFEADISHKSSNFTGPSSAFSVRHKNFLGGGEVLSVRLNVGYEWQTGQHAAAGTGQQINSYELGLGASLTFPRLVAPHFIRRNRFDTRTSFQMGADLLNRPRFFRMLSASGAVSYNFQTSPASFHDLTLFRLTYNRMLSTTPEFDALLDARRALRQSFSDQFIPAASYTYTWTRRTGRAGRDRFVWQVSPTTAGNIFAGIYELFGVQGEKRLFGLRFAQFAKLTSEVRYFKRLGSSTLAMRLGAGAAVPYGNSGQFDLPINEQFAIGGANSIRAWPIRTLGPGSFRPAADEPYGYLYQTGDFRLEANIEWRFPLFSGLFGAVFFDVGNIWLLGDDSERPGGQLRGHTFLRAAAVGTGVGLRYDLSFFVIRVDYGIGLHAPYDTGESGYFNALRARDARTLHLAVGYPF